MGTARAKRATDEVLASRDRVTQRARAISKSLSDRDERAHTDPFIRVVPDDEDRPEMRDEDSGKVTRGID